MYQMKFEQFSIFYLQYVSVKETEIQERLNKEEKSGKLTPVCVQLIPNYITIFKDSGKEKALTF